LSEKPGRKKKEWGHTRRWKDNIRMDIGVMMFNNKYLLMLLEIFGFHKNEEFMDYHVQTQNLEENSLLQA
jgi:hypothetical protein